MFKPGITADTNVATQVVLRFVSVVLPHKQCVVFWVGVFNYVEHFSQLIKRCLVARHALSLPSCLSTVDFTGSLA